RVLTKVVTWAAPLRPSPTALPGATRGHRPGPRERDGRRAGTPGCGPGAPVRRRGGAALLLSRGDLVGAVLERGGDHEHELLDRRAVVRLRRVDQLGPHPLVGVALEVLDDRVVVELPDRLDRLDQHHQTVVAAGRLL